MGIPDIIYEDNHLLIINKPAGTLTQGDRTGDISAVENGQAYLKEKYHKPGAVYLVPAHRLDRPASGVLCLARTDKAASRLAAQFRSREDGKIAKIYVAVAAARPEVFPAPAGRLQNWLRPGTGDNPKTAVLRAAAPGSKPAELLYKVLAANGEYTLLAVKLLTGYKHQIRAQLAAAAAPLAGDFKYAPPGRPPRPLANGRAVALHALMLTIEHPTKKEALTAFAPPPPHFMALGAWDVDWRRLSFT